MDTSREAPTRRAAMRTRNVRHTDTYDDLFLFTKHGAWRSERALHGEGVRSSADHVALLCLSYFYLLGVLSIIQHCTAYIPFTTTYLYHCIQKVSKTQNTNTNPNQILPSLSGCGCESVSAVCEADDRHDDAIHSFLWVLWLRQT